MIDNKDSRLEQELLDFIRKKVREEYKTNGHRCRFDVINADDIKTIAHAIESARQLGDGSLSKALATGLENHKWIACKRHKFDHFYKIFFRALIISLVTGVLSALWVGIKYSIGK